MLILLLFFGSLSSVDALSVSDAIEARVIKRQNVGVVLSYQQELFTYSDIYTHHLVMDLPKRDPAYLSMFKQAGVLSINLNVTNFLQDLSTSDPIIYAMSQERQHLSQLLDSIYGLFPEVNQAIFSNRKRRKWCVFVCNNVATQADVAILQQFTEQSSNITARNFEKLQKSMDAMASYSRITDQKFEALKIILERQSLNYKIGEAANKKTSVFVGVLATLLIPNSLHLMTLHSALILLKHNILTFDILPFEQARSILQEIQDHLKQWPLRVLVHTEPLSLYHGTDMAYFRTNSTLHISLKVKLSYFSRPLHLFKVERFELQVPNQFHGSILQHLPEYFALNDFDNEILIFNQHPTLQKDKYYFLHQGQHEIISKQTPSCIMALFNDDIQQITTLCDSFLQPFSRKPVMRHLGSNLLLLQNIERFTVIESPSFKYTLQSNCSACLRTVPCGSKVTAGHLITFIPSCPSALSPSNASYAVSHLLNLQVFGPLLTPTLLRELSAEFTFEHPVNISIPNLQIFQPSNDQRLAEAVKTLGISTIHLSAAINQTLEDGLIFQSPGDHIIYKLNEEGLGYRIRAGWNSFTSFLSNPFQIITKLLDILQWIALVYLFYKIHIITGALALLQTGVRSAAPLDNSSIKRLEEFFRTPATTTQSLKMLDYAPQVSPDFHVLDLLISLLLIIIVCCIIRLVIKRNQTRNSLELFVDIIGPEDNVLISLISLPHYAELYNFKATSFVNRIAVTGTIFHRLHLIWPSFSIQHRLISRSIRLPTVFKINPMQARRIKQILSTGFEILFFLKEAHSENFRLLPIQGSSWQRLQTMHDHSRNEITQQQNMTELLDSNPPQYV